MSLSAPPHDWAASQNLDPTQPTFQINDPQPVAATLFWEIQALPDTVPAEVRDELNSLVREEMGKVGPTYTECEKLYGIVALSTEFATKIRTRIAQARNSALGMAA